MNKVALIAWLTACAVSIWFAFHIKYKVQELETELGIARAEMRQDREAIRILEAEWSFLNQPANLADLAERHLDFSPMLAKQVVHLDEIPERGATDSEALEDIIEDILRNAPQSSGGSERNDAPLMRTGGTQ